jgi:polyribonucleotide nucleotidyltransferase
MTGVGYVASVRADRVIAEHDRAVLVADIPGEGLAAGDVGTVVHVHRNGAAFEMEFVALDGATAAVVTVEASNLRPVRMPSLDEVDGLLKEIRAKARAAGLRPAHVRAAIRRARTPR